MFYNFNMFFKEFCFISLFAANFYLLFFSYIGCYHNNNIKVQNLHENEIKATQKKIKNTRTPVNSNNFIYLERYIMADESGDPCSIDQGYDVCTKRLEQISSASGYVIRKDIKNSEVYALTADHWCKREEYPEEFIAMGLILFNKPFLQNYAFSFEGVETVDIVARDPISDICLVKFKTNHISKYKNMKIAKKEPKLGEILYTQSSPLGIYSKNVRFNLEGRYSGCTSYFCFFTIPAAPGSSGSSVINSRGEIVSIITAVIVDFNTISLGPTLKELQNFMEKNDEKIRH